MRLDLSELVYLQRRLALAPPCPTHVGILLVYPETREVVCKKCGFVTLTRDQVTE